MTNPNAYSSLSGALATRLKMQVALSGLSVVPESMDEDLDRWLESVPLPPDFADGQDATFGVSLTGDLGQLTWSAQGHPGGYIPKMAAYFSEVGISPVDTASINEAGEDVRPAQVGSWIRIRAGVMDRGWYFPVDMELKRAIGHAQSSEAGERLAAWAQTFNLETASRLGRSLGKDRFTEIHVPLAGAAAPDQLRAAVEAFAALGAPALPQPMFEALRAAQSDKLQVAVWLADAGVAKVALRVLEPSAELVRGLSDDPGSETARVIERFEDVLEADGPAVIECHFQGEVAGVERHYVPRITGTGTPKKRRDPKNLPS